jgi:hypothetical protein
MPQLIEVPGMGQVEFPDDMSDEDIVSAIKANSSPAPAAPTAAPQPAAVAPAPLPTMEPVQTPVKAAPVAATPPTMEPVAPVAATPPTMAPEVAPTAPKKSSGWNPPKLNDPDPWNRLQPKDLRKSIFSTLTEGNRMEPEDLRNIADSSKGGLGEATAAAKTAGGYFAKGLGKILGLPFNAVFGLRSPDDGRLENPQEGVLAAMDQGASLLTAQKGAKAQYGYKECMARGVTKANKKACGEAYMAIDHVCTRKSKNMAPRGEVGG